MPNANPINGHEYTIPSNDDLQYACIFPLLPGEQRDCTDLNLTACDCFDVTTTTRSAQPNPANSGAPTLQVRAKAYPGIRHLELFQQLGDQAVVGSVCPANLSDIASPAYGYRPMVRSVVEWLTRRNCQNMKP